jgi:hypothetical protein
MHSVPFMDDEEFHFRNTSIQFDAVLAVTPERRVSGFASEPNLFPHSVTRWLVGSRTPFLDVSSS